METAGYTRRCSYLNKCLGHIIFCNILYVQSVNNFLHNLSWLKRIIQSFFRKALYWLTELRFHMFLRPTSHKITGNNAFSDRHIQRRWHQTSGATETWRHTWLEAAKHDCQGTSRPSREMTTTSSSWSHSCCNSSRQNSMHHCWRSARFSLCARICVCIFIVQMENMSQQHLH